MRYLAALLADGAEVDAILIPLRPSILLNNRSNERGREKVRKLLTEKPFSSK